MRFPALHKFCWKANGLTASCAETVVCIGCLVKGETMHFEYICEAVTQGIMNLNLTYKIPVIYGILSVLTEEQAKARSGLGGAGHNSGKDWGITCVESCLLKRKYALPAA